MKTASYAPKQVHFDGIEQRRIQGKTSRTLSQAANLVQFLLSEGADLESKTCTPQVAPLRYNLLYTLAFSRYGALRGSVEALKKAKDVYEMVGSYQGNPAGFATMVHKRGVLHDIVFVQNECNCASQGLVDAALSLSSFKDQVDAKGFDFQQAVECALQRICKEQVSTQHMELSRLRLSGHTTKEAALQGVTGLVASVRSQLLTDTADSKGAAGCALALAVHMLGSEQTTQEKHESFLSDPDGAVGHLAAVQLMALALATALIVLHEDMDAFFAQLLESGERLTGGPDDAAVARWALQALAADEADDVYDMCAQFLRHAQRLLRALEHFSKKYWGEMKDVIKEE